jgi:hypothetical protein
MSAIDDTWLQQRIDATKALIIQYETAIGALAGGAQSYSLDTGQTRQVVTKADLATMRITLNELENRLATLDARLNGAGVVGMPGF